MAKLHTKNKFIYFLNAVHYGMWLNNINQGTTFSIIGYKLLTPFIYLFPKRLQTKFFEQQHRNNIEFIEFINDHNNCLSIGLTDYKLGFFYSAYSFAVAFIIIATIRKMNGGINDSLAFSIFALLIGGPFIPLYLAVFHNDRYLAYHKKFEKKDSHWKKKWRWIARGFCLLSVTFALLSIVLAFVIA